MPAHTTTATPAPSNPPTVSTDEAKPHQHRMSQAQGSAYETALMHMANTVAQTGAEEHVGDMIVAIAIEKAEGMYKLQNGTLEWTEPTAENAHIEVSARDASDHRFLPGLDVHVEVQDADGSKVLATDLPFLWHPWLYHYGSNVELPKSGTYSIGVQIDPPQFGRHDKENGKRFAEPVTVVFEGVEIKTGKA